MRTGNTDRTAGRRLALTTAILIGMISGLLPVTLPGTQLQPAYAGVPAIEVYQVPFPEQDIYDGATTLASGVSNTISSLISITAANDDTIIYYDHWEDGYEIDLDDPVQPSTETWGDGDVSNGAPTGCLVNGCDVVSAGDNIALENVVPANPRDPANLFFDGSDRIGATRPVAVTRAFWPVAPGTVLAGAVEVYPIGSWGTSYDVPVGTDVTGDSFEYTAATIQAADGGTSVDVDINGDGFVDQTLNLGSGETALVDGLLTGATIDATAPIQVHLLTGDINQGSGAYETRSFTLLPTNQWSNSYFNPVGTTRNGADVVLVVYNPGTAEITVSAEDSSGTTTSFSVPPGSNELYTVPMNSGTHLSSASDFFALASVDWDSGIYDWGFTLIPEDRLATGAAVGWGPGSEDLSQNLSPVWVTPVSDTDIYVDYDGDSSNGYDVLLNATALQSLRISDPDNDQTGMHIYTLDGTLIAVAWGQDPAEGVARDPAYDLGTTVVPLAVMSLAKEGSLARDLNGNGVLDAGEWITYTVLVTNNGSVPIDPATLEDILDPNTTYLPDTTFVDGTPFPDGGATPFPFDEAGADVGPIAPGVTVVVTYDVALAGSLPPGTDSVVNTATVNSIGLSAEVTDTLPVFQPDLDVTKVSDVGPAGARPGDTITYTVEVTNSSPTQQSGFTVTDVVPDGTTYVAESTSVTAPVATYGDFADDFESGDFAGSSGSIPWTAAWTEVGESDGPTLGDIQVLDFGGSMRLRLQNSDNGGEGVSRVMDLDAYDSALLRFDYSRQSLEAGDFVSIQVRADATSTWTEIDRIEGPDSGFVAASYQIPASFLTSTTEIRFRTSTIMSGWDQVYLDNVRVEAGTSAIETRTNQAIDPSPLDDGDIPNLVTPADPFTLADGETMTITFRVTVDDPLDSATTEITNRVFAASEQQPVFSTAEVTDPVNHSKLTLTKTLQANADEDSSGDVSLGDTLTYAFVAENTSNLQLTDVSIVDPLTGLSVLSCTPAQPATLTPSETLSCTATYVVTQADVNNGQIDNTATASGNDPDGVPVSDNDSATVPINQVTSIVLLKSLVTDLAGVGAGDSLAYEFEVTNTGTVDLDNIVVTDPLTGGVVTCPQPTLAPGASMTCSDTYVVTQADVDAGSIPNTADVAATDPAGDAVTDDDDELAILEQNPSIVLAKSLLSNADEDGSNDVSVGDTLTYQFVATNDGDVTLENVGIIDPLPGLGALSCTPGQPAVLAPAASMTCTADYTVTQANVDAGQIDNTATASGVTGIGVAVQDTDSETVTAAQNPSIVLTKSLVSNADEDGSGDVSIDDTLTYGFDIINNGNVTLTVVTLADPLPGISAFNCSPALPTAVAPGDSVDCTATYSVTQADVDAGRIDNTATVTGDDPNGNPVNDSDDETVFPDRNPSIVLAKSLLSNADEDGSNDVSVGDTLTYQFVATNDGDVTLENVGIIDPLPGLGALSCTPGQPAVLAPAASMTCTADYTVTQANVDAGQIDNTATASGDDPSTGTVQDTDSITTTASQNPSISIVKSLFDNADEDGSNGVSLDDTLTYEFVVTNTGDVTLSSVAVSDPLVGGPVSCPQTVLAPGEDMTCSATYSVTQADVDAGRIDNTAAATGEDPDGGSVGDTDDETVVASQNPSISIVKSLFANDDEDGTGNISFDDTLTYQFVATNDGDVTLSLVEITDPLPGLGVLSCTPAQPATLAPSTSITCTAIYTVTQADVDAGGINNTATVRGERPGGDIGDPGDDLTDVSIHNISIPAVPSITLVKTLDGNADEDGSGDVTVGDTLTYGFLVTNTGNVTLNAISVGDPLAGPVSCADSVLTPGASTTCSATHVVGLADADAGSILNTATVSGTDPNGTEVTDDDSVSTSVTRNPSISIVKSLFGNADGDGSGDVSLADLLTYRFVATNDGDVTLVSVRIIDPLPGLSALTCTPSMPATLAPGDTLTCDATYSVTLADADAGQILNTATTDGFDLGSTPVGDNDSLTTNVAQQPAIGLVKGLQSNADEDGSGDVSLGDTLTYSFVATNTGNVTLTGVQISDPLPGLSGLSCSPVQPATLTPGATLTCSATYAVTQTDANNGGITNTATVNASAPGGNSLSVDDTVTVPIFINPELTIVKTQSGNADEDGSGDVSLGDTLTYSFVATNTGNVTLTGVQILDPLPGLSGLSCSPVQPATLTPGATLTCSATYAVTQTDVDAGRIDNTATVRGEAPGGDPSDPDDDVTDIDSAMVPVPQNPVLSVVKVLTGNDDADGSGTVSLGDTLTFTITATNDGNVTLNNLVVSDDLTSDSTTCASVAPGDTCVLVVSYVVTQTDVNAGEITNIGTGDSDETGPASDPETVPVPQNTAISLTKTASAIDTEVVGGVGDTRVDPGDQITYSFVVSNTGNVTLDTVELDDGLIGFTGESCNDADGILAPGESTTCSATYTLSQTDIDTGSVSNTATAYGNPPSGDPTDRSDDVSDSDGTVTTIPAAPAINLTKTQSGNADEDGSGDVSLGDTLTYSFVATNTGNVTLTGVQILDPLPGLSGLSCSPVQPATLTPGATLTCSATYAVTQTDVDAGRIDNTATVRGEAPGGDPSDPDDDVTDIDSATVAPAWADLELTKIVSNSTPIIGETVIFTIRVTNDGPDAASDVTVVDVLPIGYSYDIGSMGGGDGRDESNTPTLVWAIDGIASGGSVDLTFAATVNAPTGAVDEFVNVAEVTASDQYDPDSTPDNNDGDQSEDDEDTAFVTPGILGLAKAVSGVVNQGDGSYRVTYLLTLENLGDITLGDLTVVDDLVAQLAAISPTDFAAIDGTLLANPVWDGTATSNVLAEGQSLAPGAIGTVQVAVTVWPGADLGPHDNSATATANTPSGSELTDVSTNGVDPDSDGDDGNGSVDEDGIPNEDTPTPVSMSESPSIGLAKAVTAGPTGNGDGSYDVTYSIVAENTGDVALDDVQISDDLGLTFSDAVAWEVVSLSSSDLSVSATYDGLVDIDVLDGTDALAVGATGTVIVVVRVTPGADLGPYDNSAAASAVSPAATTVADGSQDGADPDPDQDGNPSNNNDPTPVVFPALGAVSGTIWDDIDADGTLVDPEPGHGGVVVMLVDPGPDGIIGTDDDVVVATTTTNPDGTYSFINVPPGDYVVHVDVTTLPGTPTATFDIDGGLDSLAAVTVTAGTVTEDVDFGYTERFDIAIDKTVNGTPRVGERLDFFITVVNIGPGIARGPITLTDDVPDVFSVESVMAAEGWTCSVTGQLVQCSTTEDLAAGDDAYFRVAVTLTGGSGQVTNTATVTANGLNVESRYDNNSDSATINISGSELLVRTGAELDLFAAIGLLLLCLGFALVTTARRRSDDDVY